MRCLPTLAVMAAGLLIGELAQAQSSAAWFPIPANAVYLTGDSWSAGGVTYRLYGVQACLRGTTFTNSLGLKRDCGEASLAMLAALVRDLQPQCYSAAESPQARTAFVFCVATVPKGTGAGSRVDLGTALISTGFAFAALKPDGKPVHAPYFIAQLIAEQTKAGLWAFADVPDPNAVIMRALHEPRRSGQP